MVARNHCGVCHLSVAQSVATLAVNPGVMSSNPSVANSNRRLKKRHCDKLHSYSTKGLKVYGELQSVVWGTDVKKPRYR